ncbi:protein Abitram-like isoform X1 [Macrobrachium rosenbergii]|uniref:protein Abitram-like isoform X1 n=1 Tax=Macrobrachium rosenbergii TaxID=79674 RepID=UPI0034D55611
MSVAELPIEKTVELDRNYPRVSDRYFSEYYFVPAEKNKEGNGDEKCEKSTEDTMKEDETTEDQPINGGRNGEDNTFQNDNHTCVLIHSNKLCLITLSHHHPVLSEKKDIVKVNFDVGKFNRLENQVSGKGKRGAQMIGPRSPVCKVICADGTSYTILAGVNGKLIEVNERLDTNPQLLSESPKEDGYLAIVLPPLRNGNVLLNRLLSKEKYEALMNENLRESVE